jgi:hypothetical protein
LAVSVIASDSRRVKCKNVGSAATSGGVGVVTLGAAAVRALTSPSATLLGAAARVAAASTSAAIAVHDRLRLVVRDALDEIGSGNRTLIIEVADAHTFVDDDPGTSSGGSGSGSTTGSGAGSGSGNERDGEQRSGRSGETGRSRSALHVDDDGLNPRYTFETFVKGASNQFALAAALRVAETPGRSYNPLFIYGSSGLGKTHLLHAIGHYVNSHYQHDVVRYVSTETFLNEYVDGIRNNTIANFKRRYRDIDVLLIDDISINDGKFGDCSLTRIVNLYANAVQRYGPKDLGVCFEMITDRAARSLRLNDYGIEVGKAADLVVWGEDRPCDIISKCALPLAGFKRGRRMFTRTLPQLERPAA